MCGGRTFCRGDLTGGGPCALLVSAGRDRPDGKEGMAVEPFYTLTIGRSDPWTFDTLDAAREAAREWPAEGLGASIHRWTPTGSGYAVEPVE